MVSLDLQHQLWLLTLYDELYLSPIKNPQNVLDIGTGTGIWAIEFGTEDLHLLFSRWAETDFV
jgi:ubiquinone/menaquinone biosynthesis C-methylase UbiE